MDEKLMMVLEKLSMEGLDAFYLYLVMEYGTTWLLIGLIAWGVRAVWMNIKPDLGED